MTGLPILDVTVVCFEYRVVREQAGRLDIDYEMRIGMVLTQMPRDQQTEPIGEDQLAVIVNNTDTVANRLAR